jgi:basic membrane lipoprotein Med (substrate-binding protein (PBP1-ABC) superfamily)
MVHHNADQAALGAFQAVKESPNAFIFGANLDQRALAPDRVIGSAIIDLPKAFVTVARAVRGGGYTPRMESFGLKSGVIRYVPNPSLARLLPESLRTRLQAATDSIMHADPETAANP